MESGLLAIALSLASALTWGAGDFCGGMATRSCAVRRVLTGAHLSSGTILLLATLILGTPLPPAGDIALAALAGVIGAVGLLALYSALAIGPMGFVSPYVSIVTVALPLVVGALTDGLPGHSQMIGFGFAVIAVILLSQDGERLAIRVRALALPTLAGLAFGLFFVLIDRASAEGVLWSNVTARFFSLLILIAIALVRHEPVFPPRDQLPLIALAGTMDLCGNGLFALSARVGRLDIAAVLGALSPAATVFLAWLVVKERLKLMQWFGVAAAVVALALIAL